MKWSEVAQSCPTLCNPMDCSLPGSSVHGIFQARILEWVAISFSRGSSRPWDWTQVFCIAGRRFTIWATRACIISNLYRNFQMKMIGLLISCPWQEFSDRTGRIIQTSPTLTQMTWEYMGAYLCEFWETVAAEWGWDGILGTADATIWMWVERRVWKTLVGVWKPRYVFVLSSWGSKTLLE